MVASLQSGSWQARIAAAAEGRAADLASGAEVIVGTTAFLDWDERPPAVLLVEPDSGAPDGFEAGAVHFTALVPRRDAEAFEAVETRP